MPTPITPLNWIVAPGIAPPSTPSPRNSRAGRFGSRLAFCIRNVHWFNFTVGSPVSSASVPSTTLAGAVSRVGCTVPVVVGTGDARYVIRYVIFVVSSCTFTSSPDPDPPMNTVL
ncbi:hypothetical protein BLA6860_03320 [Burkholderia lata]|nr:hypothetical protein BLA6860_03320 [Burkholderia lata]